MYYNNLFLNNSSKIQHKHKVTLFTEQEELKNILSKKGRKNRIGIS